MRSLHWLCAVAMFGIGCDNNETSPAAESSPAQESESAEPAAEAPPEAAVTPAAGMTPAPGKAPPAEALAELGMALGAATMAEGGTPCDRAWNGMTVMMEAMDKQMGGSRATDMMPQRSTFLEVCRGLPEPAQNCMDMGYAVGHRDECQEILQSPEMQRVRQMMQGG